MKYFTRTEKYQKYVNGVPTDEFKEGDSIGVFQFGTMNECETYSEWTSNNDTVLNPSSEGFTENKIGQGIDNDYYYFTIDGAGTLLKLIPTVVKSSYVDLSNVTNLKNLFFNNNDYIGGNFTGWNTSNVTDMTDMFYGCSSLKALDLSSFDTSKVSTVGRMFYGCSSLKELNISGWDLTKAHNDSYISGMFINCTSLQTIYAYNCNETTIGIINNALSNAGLTDKVTIITQ